MLPSLLRTCLLLLVLPTLTARSQQTVFPDDERGRHWVATAALGLNSPFASEDFSAAWVGRHAVMLSLEYYPTADASFGGFVSHTTLDHSGRTHLGAADCMRGIMREQTGAGLIARIHAVRWNGFSLIVGASVGATNVTRERPLLNLDGSAYGIASLSSSIDLGFGGTFGIEATVAPGTSVALEAGYEGIENQVVLNESLIARTSIRFAL